MSTTAAATDFTFSYATSVVTLAWNYTGSNPSSFNLRRRRASSGSFWVNLGSSGDGTVRTYADSITLDATGYFYEITATSTDTSAPVYIWAYLTTGTYISVPLYLLAISGGYVGSTPLYVLVDKDSPSSRPAYITIPVPWESESLIMCMPQSLNVAWGGAIVGGKASIPVWNMHGGMIAGGKCIWPKFLKVSWGGAIVGGPAPQDGQQFVAKVEFPASGGAIVGATKCIRFEYYTDDDRYIQSAPDQTEWVLTENTDRFVRTEA